MTLIITISNNNNTFVKSLKFVLLISFYKIYYTEYYSHFIIYINPLNKQLFYIYKYK